MSVTVSRLTPPGRGAVAVIRVCSQSPADAEVLDRHFRSASNRKTSAVGTDRILYGHWGAEDVVIVRTADTQWEINCHGGEAAVGRIIADLGGETDSRSESFLEDRLLSELIRCRTQRTANHVLSQHQGVLRTFLQQLQAVTTTQDAVDAVQSFLKWESFASHLSTPWKVAVVGQPNAGKSSLLNAILGYERSIVFDQPGTTRDRVEAEVYVDGWPFVLVDTAGVRDDAADEIELIGVQAARSSITASDACLLVADATAGWTTDDQRLIAEIAGSKPLVVLWNKVDLATAGDQPAPPGTPVLATSAMTQQGLADVLDWLAETFVHQIPPDDQPLPVLADLTTELRTFIENPELPRLQLCVQKWLS